MRLPKALGVSFSCFSLALALTTVCSAQEKKVKVWIGGMHCAQVTNDDDRDEVYILVRAKESTGREIEHRLPHPDDYFESRTGTHLQQEGWTNKNQGKASAEFS